MKFKDFFDVLEENLADCDEDLLFLHYGPDLFDVLCKILYEESIDHDTRLKINAAIAYYVIPLDTISEQFYGPYGYVDDVFLTVFVLRDVAVEYGYVFLQRLWDKRASWKHFKVLWFDRVKLFLKNNFPLFY